MDSKDEGRWIAGATNVPRLAAAGDPDMEMSPRAKARTKVRIMSRAGTNRLSRCINCQSVSLADFVSQYMFSHAMVIDVRHCMVLS